MPNFRTHTNLNMDLYAIFVMSMLISGRIDIVMHSLGFVFGTFWCSPDMDMNHTTPDQNWGHLEYYWNAYSWIFSHRSTRKYGISHWPVLGTATRAIFLLGLVTISTALTPYSYDVRNWVLSDNGLYFYVSWCIADIVHIFADKVQDVTTNGRRKYRKIIVNGGGRKVKRKVDWPPPKVKENID